ncbi:hypothetical protein RHMOL_Rhmol04G0151400 [Rhododendron molle]|uniref:Uncharacterized protein n=1 Tax=Rhododendron molle TaxID=49168 RepID=A0ACC0P0Y9_RHOML|nr:hypothetical protein RHMOL_Rhmol04G0151400 [Rhododendron molle]
MAGHGGNGGSGKMIDQAEDRGGPMEIEPVEYQPVEAIGGGGAAVVDGGDGGQGGEQAVDDGGEHRTLEAEPRAMEEIGAEGPNIKPLDSSMVTESSVVSSVAAEAIIARRS